MKTKKELIYDFMIQETMDNQTAINFTTKEIAERLHMQRSNVSSILNELVRENRVNKLNMRPVVFQVVNHPNHNSNEESCFQNLVGNSTSLKNAIRLAKAAILYPHHSLPILLLGAVGVGKSEFAKTMYEFAKEKSIIQKNAPFIKLNCHFLNEVSEEEVVERLFGDFQSKAGALKQAKDGVLYINHIDLLHSKARNRFFELLEEENEDIQNTIIICSASNAMNRTLYELLISKFSIKIKIPSLNVRELEERFQLLQNFFYQEAEIVKRDIYINSELLRCLLLYPCEENIKQLGNDIRSGCANAYVREFNMGVDKLHVYINDFPNYVRKGFLLYKKNRDTLEYLIPPDYSYIFSQKTMRKLKEKSKEIINPTIYDVINQKAEELRLQGILEKDINTIIGENIEVDIQKITKHIISQDINKESLSKIVDDKIIYIVESFLNEASKEFGRVYSTSTFYGLCLHLSAVFNRSKSKQRLSSKKITEVIETNKEEYEYSLQAILKWEKKFNITIPIDEAVFITMFLCENDMQIKEYKKPVVLIVMHGN